MLVGITPTFLDIRHLKNPSSKGWLVILILAVDDLKHVPVSHKISKSISSNSCFIKTALGMQKKNTCLSPGFPTPKIRKHLTPCFKDKT